MYTDDSYSVIVKHPPKDHVFESLVPNWRRYFENWGLFVIEALAGKSKSVRETFEAFN